MNAQHTPGPWIVDANHDVCSTSGSIAWLPTTVRRRANARLIAAAPDLYAALRDIHATIIRAQLCPFEIPLMRDDCECNYHAAAKAGRAALAAVDGV